MYVPMGKDPEKHPKPFVTLTDGTTIQSKKVTEKKGKIKTDDATYKNKEVQSYCDGKSTYVAIGKGFLVPRIYEGDYNIYEISSSELSTEYVGVSPASPSGWSTGSHSHTWTYVQKAGTDSFKYFNYKNLKSMIPPSDPGFNI